MTTTPWGEDPSTFHEPWCLECGANTKRACKCDEAVAFYTWTVAEYPVFYCHTCRPDDLGAGGGLITDLAGDVVKCSQCQKELR